MPDEVAKPGFNARLKRLWKPFRAGLSFLSDLGGALALVLAAIALVAAAITGAVLVALDVVPQPFFTMLVLGMASGAVGLGFHLLRGPLSPPVQTTPPAPPSTPQSSPNERAAAKEREWRERQEAIALRRATRKIREELLDLRALLEESYVSSNNSFWENNTSPVSWDENHEALLDHADSRPYEAASEAYRKLGGIRLARFTRSGGTLSFDARTPVPTSEEFDEVFDAVDTAADALKQTQDTSP